MEAGKTTDNQVRGAVAMQTGREPGSDLTRCVAPGVSNLLDHISVVPQAWADKVSSTSARVIARPGPAPSRIAWTPA